MRGGRSAAAFAVAMAVSVTLIGAGAAAADLMEPPTRAVALDGAGCPVKEQELEAEAAWPAPWLAYRRALVEDRAVSAVLCKSGHGGWSDALRITRGIRDLERLLHDLPRTEPDLPSHLAGIATMNLVLDHADGTHTVLSFEFNSDEVNGRRAVRVGAAGLSGRIAALWRREHTAADPAAIAPVACPKKASRHGPLTPLAPEIPRAYDYFHLVPDEAELPVPLAVVSACRYTADARGILRLRARNHTREVPEDVRRAVNARPAGTSGCQDARPTEMDVLHLTDVTARTLTLHLTRKPCENDLDPHFAVTRPIAPELRTLLTRLLG